MIDKQALLEALMAYEGNDFFVPDNLLAFIGKIEDNPVYIDLGHSCY